MKTLILSVANWLTSAHTITLDGWQWLVLIPVAGLVLLVVGYVLSWWFIAAAVGGR